MNIDDAKVDKAPETVSEIIRTMYARQCELMAKYKNIEQANGFDILTRDGPLDNRFVQLRIKDNFWRTTEEVAEAFEVLPSETDLLEWRELWASRPDMRHFFEELIDALHFLIEASICGGMTPTDITDALPRVHARSAETARVYLECQAFRFIVKMGLAANCLKNKPWKQTHMVTDEGNFRAHMNQAWYEYAMLLTLLGMDYTDMWTLYMKKAEVNTFRQRSQY